MPSLLHERCGGRRATVLLRPPRDRRAVPASRSRPAERRLRSRRDDRLDRPCRRRPARGRQRSPRSASGAARAAVALAARRGGRVRAAGRRAPRLANGARRVRRCRARCSSTPCWASARRFVAAASSSWRSSGCSSPSRSRRGPLAVLVGSSSGRRPPGLVPRRARLRRARDDGSRRRARAVSTRRRGRSSRLRSLGHRRRRVGVILGARSRACSASTSEPPSSSSRSPPRADAAAGASLARGRCRGVARQARSRCASGELGFLNEWFGSTQKRPGQYAASWSQRLIFAYVGGRVFLDHPVLGTGWYGELPPKEFARYLPDAQRAFPDQPAHYFPQPTGDLHPAADIRPGALRARHRRRRCSSSRSPLLAVRTAVRVGRDWPAGTRTSSPASLRLAGRARSARSQARRSSEGSRSRRCSG